MAEIGETLVADWYQYVDACDLVVEGVRLPKQGELDVLAVAGRRVAQRKSQRTSSTSTTAATPQRWSG